MKNRKQYEEFRKEEQGREKREKDKSRNTKNDKKQWSDANVFHNCLEQSPI